MENTEKEMVVLTPFEQQKSELQQFVVDYKGLVVTKENLKESNEKRLVLYRKRMEIQRVAKSNKDALNKAKKINDQREEELVGVIKPVEDDIQNKVQAIENVEKERVATHKKFVDGVRDRIMSVVTTTSLEVLAKTEADFEAWIAGYDAEEFKAELDSNAVALRAAIASTKANLQAIADAEAKKIADEAEAKKKLEQDALKVGNSLFDDEPEQELVAKDKSGLLEASGLDKVLDIKIEKPTSQNSSHSGSFGVPQPSPPTTPAPQTVTLNHYDEGYGFYIDPSLSPKSIKEISDAISLAISNNEGF
jgi:hypothetical protein